MSHAEATINHSQAHALDGAGQSCPANQNWKAFKECLLSACVAAHLDLGIAVRGHLLKQALVLQQQLLVLLVPALVQRILAPQQLVVALCLGRQLCLELVIQRRQLRLHSVDTYS